MHEQIEIKPELESLKNISPFWDNEKSILEFDKSDYSELQKFISDYKINIRIDDLCYIVIMLRQEKRRIDIRYHTAEERLKFQNDKLEVSKFLKQHESNPELYINSIKFDYGQRKFNKFNGEFIYRKKGSFTIEHPDRIKEIIDIIWGTYKFKSSLRDDYDKLLKLHEKINNKQFTIQTLAKNLNKYFTNNTTINLNLRYFIIGYLFQFTGLETELSEDRFKDIQEVSYHTYYKTYRDFVTKNIRSKYFKVVTNRTENK